MVPSVVVQCAAASFPATRPGSPHSTHDAECQACICLVRVAIFFRRSNEANIMAAAVQLWLALAVTADHHAHHDWLVIGGGPVGTLAVAVLLKRGAQNVAWVERSFERMGRLAAYGSVPANTRNDRLVNVFRSLPDFSFDASQARRRERSDDGPLLSDAEPQGTLPLQASLDALRDGSNALRWHARVVPYAGEVISLYGGQADGWSTAVRMAPAEVNGTRRRRAEVFLVADRVIVATGAVPRRPPAQLTAVLDAAGVRLLEFDDAVAPARLSELCAPRTNASDAEPALRAANSTGDGARTLRGALFAVVGGSHSGMLAARNALEVCDAASVHVFSRGAIRLAEEREGWIKYDGTGLKGEVRDWAIEVLDAQRADHMPLRGAGMGSPGAGEGVGSGGASCAPQVSFDGTITEHCDGERAGTTATHGEERGEEAVSRVVLHTDAPHTGEVEADVAELGRRLVGLQIEALAWATGFERQREGLPAVSWMGVTIDLARAAYDGRNGAVNGAPGLHGVGIGFPEVYTDPEGLSEPRVGFVNSFVDHMHRIFDSSTARAVDHRT